MTHAATASKTPDAKLNANLTAHLTGAAAANDGSAPAGNPGFQAKNGAFDQNLSYSGAIWGQFGRHQQLGGDHAGC